MDINKLIKRQFVCFNSNKYATVVIMMLNVAQKEKVITTPNLGLRVRK